MFLFAILAGFAGYFGNRNVGVVTSADLQALSISSLHPDSAVAAQTTNFKTKCAPGKGVHKAIPASVAYKYDYSGTQQDVFAYYDTTLRQQHWKASGQPGSPGGSASNVSSTYQSTANRKKINLTIGYSDESPGGYTMTVSTPSRKKC